MTRSSPFARSCHATDSNVIHFHKSHAHRYILHARSRCSKWFGFANVLCQVSWPHWTYAPSSSKQCWRVAGVTLNTMLVRGKRCGISRFVKWGINIVTKGGFFCLSLDPISMQGSTKKHNPLVLSVLAKYAKISKSLQKNAVVYRQGFVSLAVVSAAGGRK